MDIPAINRDMDRYLAESQRSQRQLELAQEKAQAASAGLSEEEKQELRAACQSFESYFLQIMFREMRKTSFTDNTPMAQSQAEKTFTDMLDEEVSKATAKSGGIGLAEMMYKQMTARYEMRTADSGA